MDLTYQLSLTLSSRTQIFSPPRSHRAGYQAHVADTRFLVALEELLSSFTELPIGVFYFLSKPTVLWDADILSEGALNHSCAF